LFNETIETAVGEVPCVLPIALLMEPEMKKRGRPTKGTERLETRLGFRIPQSLHEQVLKICEENQMSKSDFILESIQRNLTLKAEVQ
jgi:hypothetical protein